VASDFAYNIASLSSLLKFGNKRLPHGWSASCSCLDKTQEAMDLTIFPIVFAPIRTLAYHMFADLGRFLTVRYNGPLSFIPSGRLESQSLKRRTGSFSPPSVLNINCCVDLRLILRSPLLVLVGFSRYFTTSDPSSCCRIMKSST
jgi:hypothetical protein